MKKLFLAFTVTLLTIVIVLGACNKQKAPKSENMVVETTEITPDEIVESFATDKSGNELHMKYNNSKGTVTMVYKGDTITMKEDTTASGLRFKNSEYEYEEWQGQIKLKKNGQVIFDNQK